MATLKITAKADVSSAKASLRELTQEEANLLAKEKEANLQRRLDYAKTTKEQRALRKQAGDASKDELASLTRAERIAAADAKMAAREVAQAKRDAARAGTSDLRETIRRGQDFISERRKLMPTAKSKDDLGGDNPNVRQYLGEGLGKFAGPAAGVAILTAIATAVREMSAEIKALRLDLAKSTIETGKEAIGFRRAASAAGLNDDQATKIIDHAIKVQQAVPAGDWLREASKRLTTGSEADVIKETDADLSFKDTLTPEEQAQRSSLRAQREKELATRDRGIKEARKQNREERARMAREFAQLDSHFNRTDLQSARLDEWLTSDESIRNKGFSGSEEYVNYMYNEIIQDRYRKSFKGEVPADKLISVRLIADDTQKRPLSGD
jgi:hypothetical protein